MRSGGKPNDLNISLPNDLRVASGGKRKKGGKKEEKKERRSKKYEYARICIHYFRFKRR